jgi:predicted metal-dependent hydrolase
MSDVFVYDSRLFSPWEKGLHLYETYNIRYFRQQLPIVKVGFYKKMGKTEHGFTLRPVGAKFAQVICLNPYFEKWGDVLRQTLLHEMIHVKQGCKLGHGPKFKKELKRLINEGAFDNLL